MRTQEVENRVMEIGNMSPDFRCVVQERDGIRYAYLSGELDLAYRVELVQLLTSPPGVTLIAELSGLTFLDAAGLSALLSAKRHVEAAGHRFEVRGARGGVRRLFELTNLQSLLND